MAVTTRRKAPFAFVMLLLFCYGQGYCRTLQDDVNVVSQILSSNGITNVLFMEVTDVVNNRVAHLRLDSLNISVLPECIGQLDSLSSLDLRHNNLVGLPDSIGMLTKLTSLSLEGNELASLPASFGGLVKLSSLSLQGNKLTSLPASFGNLASLSTLWLGDINTAAGNLLTSLPDTIGNLKGLRFLDVSNNLLVQIPYSISNIQYILTLNLKNNKLTTLPKYCFTYLRGSLDLSYNEFVDFPDIGGAYLQYLVISHNHLKTLPYTFNDYEYLSEVDAECNEMDTLPDILGDMTRLTNINLDSNQIECITEYFNENQKFNSWLKQISLNDNKLRNLPGNISIVPANVWVRRNMLCSVDTATATWLDGHSNDKNWRNLQNCTVPLRNVLRRECRRIQPRIAYCAGGIFLYFDSDSKNRLTLELFNGLGKKLGCFHDGLWNANGGKIPLSTRFLVEGKYFFRLNQDDASYTFPITSVK
jgi:Leucine-rich repeat (LRR) protein